MSQTSRAWRTRTGGVNILGSMVDSTIEPKHDMTKSNQRVGQAGERRSLMSNIFEATESHSSLPTLSEALSSRKTNGLFTVAFVDTVGSFSRMATQVAATWMAEQEFVYRAIVESLEQLGLLTDVALLKWEGDGAAIVVDSGKAADLINVMILLMERLAKAAQRPTGHFSGEVVIQMRCGIATGELLQYIPPNGGVDFAGPAMAVASRLSTLGSPNAILADVTTIETANMGLVRSQLGGYRNRTPAQYRGEVQVVPVKGIEGPFPYHEINWEESPFGLASTAVTETTKPTQSAPTPSSATRVRPGAADKMVGKVKVWLKDKRYGFVTGSDGEEFYLSMKGLVYSDDVEMLSAGADVAFSVAPPLREGAARRAVTTLVAGSDADGRLAYRNSAKRFGFITVTDSFGAAISVHVQIPEGADWAIGTEIAFTVATGPLGPSALNPDVVVDDGGNLPLQADGAA